MSNRHPLIYNRFTILKGGVSMRSGETLFNCYQLVKLLGEGGTSKVYLARNTKVGQLVAVKIIDKRKGGNAWLAEKDLLIRTASSVDTGHYRYRGGRGLFLSG